ncbi:MAG: nitrite/sulfite reductase [Flavobacteriaceae bacterium]|jgi:sulfite reductase (ferredoxin)|nr:nitrite/sulfite reductase [Flavobacteriaceae bacterium]
MQSFRTEIENPIVEKDIIDLEQKIHAFKNNAIDEEKFRSLRLARGVYGQRQQGVQMVRIKLPMGRFTAKQLKKIAYVADEYGSGNLHITTRQDIQLHYVELDRTPQLWEELEKDQITLREACGNTVRNVTASATAGVDLDEPFDITPFAEAFFQYFLRNPICQDMGRKIKVAFSSNKQDDALTFIHDLGFIPKIKDGKAGFQLMLGGGIGSQPMPSQKLFDFLTTDQIIPYSEAIIRLFDRHGERNKRNKARLKFLVKDLGLEQFLTLVEVEKKSLLTQSLPIQTTERKLDAAQIKLDEIDVQTDSAFTQWKKVNTFPQKQTGYLSVGIAVQTGDISSNKARKLAEVITRFTKNDNRFTIAQSILLRDVKEEHLPALYLALKALDFHRIGFHKTNDIVACPGTDTCNLGIASSYGLARELQKLIEGEFNHLIEAHDLKIRISGCMNACGQHTLGHIGFQGMTLKANGNIAPATQILLGGGVLGNGNGRFADKVLKVPAKRTPDVLRWILTDFESNKLNSEDFFAYYDRKTKDYFYQNLKHHSETDQLKPKDFIDWGNETKYEKAIGIGECAGVTIDLIQTLIFEAEEAYGWALSALNENRLSDAVYHAYNGRIRAAKALLIANEQKTNSHKTIIDGFDIQFPHFKESNGVTFKEGIKNFTQESPDTSFAKNFIQETQSIIAWVKKERNAK